MKIQADGIYYINVVYGVPYEVIAYTLSVSRSTVYRLKKKIMEKEKLYGSKDKVLKKIKDKIENYSLLPKDEYNNLKNYSL
ncbi:MAG: hypothetical protein QXJ14_02755 [Candidatus Aenigmatarchaeota archaeon]